eukprot:16442203-Heterocapsa_arctica.AAC.1
MASHIVRRFVDLCRLKAVSCFALLVDTKAFDRIIRDLVLGLRDDVQDPRARLQSLGLDHGQPDCLLSFVSRHGCLFESWGLDKNVLCLIRNLHSNSWFSYGTLDSAIVVK